MSGQAGHDALLLFDTQHPEFARGFEMGRLWCLCRVVDGEIIETAHGVNAEMILRVAEATGREVHSEELGDGWIEVVFSEPQS